MKILTVCRAGLVRSVALNDVLKLHYENTDVLSVGADLNSPETHEMLFNWADTIILMQQHYVDKIPDKYLHKVMTCEVGADVWGSPKNPELIAKVWNWVRDNIQQLNIVEHDRHI